MARKRKNGRRTACGRLGQTVVEVEARKTAEAAESERDALGVGLEARKKHYGLTEGQARSQLAGSVMGRLVFLGQKGGGISIEQHTAGQYYLADREAYMRAILAPDQPSPPAPEFWATSTKPYEEFVADARSRWEKVRVIIREAMIEDRSPEKAAALDTFLVRDKMDPRLLGALREALNLLVRHYLIGKRKAA